MKIRTMTIAVTALAALLLSHPQSFGDAMSDSVAVQATIDQMTTAFAAGDLDGVLATYEPGAVVVGQPGANAQGTEALRKLFEGFIAVHPKFSFDAQNAIVSGDIAVHFNTWKMEGTMPDGTKIHDGGLSVAVLRKQPNGKWLMVIDNPHAGLMPSAQ